MERRTLSTTNYLDQLGLKSKGAFLLVVAGSKKLGFVCIVYITDRNTLKSFEFKQIDT